MCLILLAIDQHPDFPLILAANRDEFFARPTGAANYWKGTQGMLAGRDLKAGGTWLGITRAGRLAAVTNLREPPVHEGKKTSRGMLPVDFLKGKVSPQHYVESLLARRLDFDGFNFLAGTLGDYSAVSGAIGDNADASPDRSGESGNPVKELPPQTNICFLNSREDRICELEPGIHGVSNGPLDADWPKVAKGKKTLQSLMPSSAGIPSSKLRDPRTELTDKLFALLADRTVPADSELPDTGVEPDIERMLGSIFVHGEDYGTRSSTVVIMGKDGSVHFEEWTWSTNGKSHDRSISRFKLAAGAD